ncbi:MAG TPA: HEAT repeat domain-containing protein [Kofleriaceae bacterium]|nr:HEAT repeat domain-containing protein [Kofleriaceae bacterium]
MTTSCPTCHKPVDPLRSRFVAVQDGKVVAYCSAECATPAERADGPPAASGEALPWAGVPTLSAPSSDGPPRPSIPAPGPAPGPTPGDPIFVDSGPIIEILREPASGDVTEGKGSIAGQGLRDSLARGTPRGVTRAGDERTVPRTDSPGERPRSPSEPASHDAGAVRTTSALGSAPVGPSSARRDHGFATSPNGDVARPRKRRTSLVLFSVLLPLAAVGGLAYQYLVPHNLSAAAKVLPVPAAAAAQVATAEPPRPPALAAVAAVPTASATVIDVAAAVEQARATLQANLAATSPRLSRIATAALARMHDPTACDALAAQLGLVGTHDRVPRPGASEASGADRPSTPPPVRPSETSDIARLDLAYSLARCGDPRGNGALAAALRSPRTDVRDEAARLLALLGDHRAIPHLIDVLAVSQRRLGAAEHLAHLAESHAIKVLEQIRGDAKASSDDKARATIALGIAGHADVAAALRDMLGDSHENAFAAAALVELKDGAARSVLEHQLDSPMLRVRAARALRRLDPTLDPTPILPRLLEVLRTGRDIDRIQAAEAILLLAGSPSWSAFE